MGYGQNGDKSKWRHAKTATDCSDQNGDKLKRQREQCVERNVRGQRRPIFIAVSSLRYCSWQ